MALRRMLQHCRVVLDPDEHSLTALVSALLERPEIELRQRQAVRAVLDTQGLPELRDLGQGVGVLRLVHGAGQTSQLFLVRLQRPLDDPDAPHLSFLWISIGPDGGVQIPDSEFEPFAWMLQDERFADDALTAGTPDRLLAVYERYLNFVETPSPETHRVPAALRRTGRPFGGLVLDVRRKIRHYASDFRDGLHPKVLASTLFLFFACLAPAIAFGGMLSVLTGGSLGAIEMIVATAICGTTYALLSGQPLTILGSTGPIVIFLGILYSLCEQLGIPFLPTLSWCGLWTAGIVIALVAFETCSWIRYFTRFTDEIFAALISVIFIVEALKDAFGGFADEDVAYDTALLSLILAFGTYYIAMQLTQIRQSPYLRRPLREFLADFGPTIAIVLMTFVALWLHPVDLELLDIPARFTTSTGRPWLVNPFEAPVWVWFAAAAPAMLLTTLVYLDQNITVRLVNNPDYKLEKGAGYHLDLLIVGLLIGVCSVFGLPWMVAATVRSLNHVRSLTETEERRGESRITGVRENRVSALAVHLMVATSLLLMDVMRAIPMAVLFGLFLFMGVSSLRHNQFVERLRLWVMDPKQYPESHFLRQVPSRVVHWFTAIQAACLAALWVVKTSHPYVAITFPLAIALLVPVRMLLNRFFSPTQLALLDAEALPAEEEFRDLD